MPDVLVIVDDENANQTQGLTCQETLRSRAYIQMNSRAASKQYSFVCI